MNISPSPGSPGIISPPPLPTNATRRTSRLAIVSLVLGLLGFLVLPAIGGLVCGLIGRAKIRRSNGQLHGGGLALAGITISALMLILTALAVSMWGTWLQPMGDARTRAQLMMGQTNLRQIALAAILQADDHDDKFLPTTNWCDTLAPTLSPSVFRRPSDPNAGPGGYAYNARVAGRKVSEVNPQTVLFFELETPAWNVSGGPELLRRPAHARDPVVLVFVDGHSEAIVGERLSQLRWDP